MRDPPRPAPTRTTVPCCRPAPASAAGVLPRPAPGAGLVEDCQGVDEGRHRKDRRVAQLPAVGSPPRLELVPHGEAGLRIVSPPSGEAGKGRVISMSLVDEAAADRTRSRVQVFVRAPDREVDPPVVKPQDNIARSVREVEADKASLPPRGGAEADRKSVV